jgi:hypothetical protein
MRREGVVMVFNATFDNISVQLYHGGRLKTGIV